MSRTIRVPLVFHMIGSTWQKAEMVEAREALLGRGHQVNARWLHGADALGGVITQEQFDATLVADNLRATEELQDASTARLSVSVADIMSSDVVLAFVPTVGNQAYLAEWGMALGMMFANPQLQKRMVLLGPADVIYTAIKGSLSWEDFPTFLAWFDEQDVRCGHTSMVKEPDGTLRTMGPCVLHSWHTGGHAGEPDVQQIEARMLAADQQKQRVATNGQGLHIVGDA